jgi:hypothetical protein
MPATNRATLTASIGIAAFAGLVFGCVGGGIGGYQIRKGQEAAPQVVPKPAPPSDAQRSPARPSGPMSRKAFDAAVTGKTRDQIIAAVGRLDDTRERVPGDRGSRVDARVSHGSPSRGGAKFSTTTLSAGRTNGMLFFR